MAHTRTFLSFLFMIPLGLSLTSIGVNNLVNPSEEIESMAPLHDYECLLCHTRFEKLVKSGEKVECINCGHSQLQLRISAPSGYKIKGNNSASVTPKKFRGGK